MKSALKVVVLCAYASLVSLSMPASVTTPSPIKNEKLVVILLDGFRWDYVDMHKDKEALPGFRQLHKEGVRGN
jgi:predicted AlkP superfamily pyrophosphatase or phosphodiesterase